MRFYDPLSTARIPTEICGTVSTTAGGARNKGAAQPAAVAIAAITGTNWVSRALVTDYSASC